MIFNADRERYLFTIEDIAKDSRFARAAENGQAGLRGEEMCLPVRWGFGWRLPGRVSGEAW